MSVFDTYCMYNISVYQSALVFYTSHASRFTHRSPAGSADQQSIGLM